MEFMFFEHEKILDDKIAKIITESLKKYSKEDHSKIEEVIIQPWKLFKNISFQYWKCDKAESWKICKRKIFHNGKDDMWVLD